MDPWKLLNDVITPGLLIVAFVCGAVLIVWGTFEVVTRGGI